MSFFAQTIHPGVQLILLVLDAKLGSIDRGRQQEGVRRVCPIFSGDASEYPALHTLELAPPISTRQPVLSNPNALLASET